MKRLFKALLFTALAAITACGAESPTFIPFQGRITDQNGNTYTNGQYTILFQLYNQAVGGTAIWQERHDKVGVVNGLVNVFLGSITPLPDDFSSTRHLGITIDADGLSGTPEPEMVPRQMIIPAFWAKNSEKLAGRDWTSIFLTNSPLGLIPATKIEPLGPSQIKLGAIGSAQIASNAIQAINIPDGLITASKLDPQLILDSVIPSGTITAFGGTNIPAGWLLCDGRLVTSAQYPRLYGAIGKSWGGVPDGPIVNFNLPDLRGQFLRGVDSMADLTLLPIAIVTTNDTLILTNHGINRSGYPLLLSNSGGSLPSPLSSGTIYYAIVVDLNTIKLAITENNASANLSIDITTAGTGMHKVVSAIDPDKAGRIKETAGGNVGNQVGTFQSDVVGAHQHNLYLGSLSLVLGNPGNANTVYNSTTQVSPVTYVTPSGSGIGSETRPKNTYVHYIIKY